MTLTPDYSNKQGLIGNQFTLIFEQKCFNVDNFCTKMLMFWL